jgi:CubicO group peptidase (beta-lactamase class C family)
LRLWFDDDFDTYKGFILSTRIFTILASLLLAFHGSTAAQFNKKFSKPLESSIEKTMESSRMPGLAIAIVHNGKEVYSKAFGVRDVETNAPLTTNDLFHWASVTKPFVATAAMQLVEQGKLDLDGKITTYLPYFRMNDPAYKEITVRHLLTHTAGMPDVQDYEWDKPQYDEEALERWVRSMGDRTLLYPPEEGHRYSNMGFEVMGDVLAKASGKSFEQCVADQIFQPLKMTSATLLINNTDPNDRVSPHTVKNKKAVVREHWPYNRRHAPSSTLIANVHDLGRWAIANLNRGQLEGARILKEESYDTLWRPTVDSAPAQGLSWFIGKRSGYRTIEHQGGDQGFRTALVLIPELNLGIAVATNTDRASVAATLRLAIESSAAQNKK